LVTRPPLVKKKVRIFLPGGVNTLYYVFMFNHETRSADLWIQNNCIFIEITISIVWEHWPDTPK